MSPAFGWEALAGHASLGILVDLDGTLIPFADRPEHARPGPGLIALLRDLASAPGVSIAVVSGRARASLDRLFAEAPGVWLVAEHGGWLRGDGAWRAALGDGLGHIEPLAAAFDEIASQHEGAWVERKTWSACLHYRSVARHDKAGLLAQASAAFDACAAASHCYERLDGAEVFEVRPRALRKSAAIPWIRAKVGPDARLVAFGDDRTDEDMFRALGPGDDPIQVGPDVARPTAARWWLPGPDATLALLRWLLDARGMESPPPPDLLPSPVPPSRRAP